MPAAHPPVASPEAPSSPVAPAQPRPGRPAFLDLRRHGDRPALLTGHETLTYAALADRVEAFAARLGATRRLVLLTGGNDVATLVAYLGALTGGHPVILAPGGNTEHLGALEAAYDPDVVVRDGAAHERRPGTAHDLHPELALLLSTSGSTGSPKLVRLSAANLSANAAQIATFLALTAEDRAATTLPLHYCYGLSVVHSHLLVGAGLVLSDLSVVDPCFWELFRAQGATSFAGVPYTFELLDRVGFARLRLPNLRYVTAAGGRLAPEAVRRFAALGKQRGFELFVMYGQTEATARIAYLPPDLAHQHPQAVGVPVPGGALRIDPVAEMVDPDVGELVYSGPNVMLGYAEGPADLALGRSVHELRTGDLARRTGSGPEALVELVGRVDRHAKLFGLRIDLDHVERALCERGLRAACVADCDRLVVAVEQDDTGARHLVARTCGLPARAIRTVALPEMPTLPNGKTDYRSLVGLSSATQPSTTAPAGKRTDALVALYAELLGHDRVTDADTFVGLGGDSLSYVEMSVRLEDVLGQLPAEWHTTPIRDLAPVTRRRFGRAVDTSVLLRAAAILLVVCSHANLLMVQGGAHVLLTVAGFNLARFQLSAPTRRERTRHVFASVARVAVPSMVWISAVGSLTGTYGVANVFFLNGVFGSDDWTLRWQFWFLEALVWTLVAVGAGLAVPAVDRLERRWPFAFAAAVLGAGLVARYLLVGVEAGPTERYTPSVVVWFVALGWAIARATTTGQRVLLSAVTLVAVPGFFGQPAREALIIAGVALLTWTSTLRVPRAVGRLASVVASASLYVYLTHWQVYPSLEDRVPVLAVLASLAVGIAYWQLTTRVTAACLPAGRRQAERASCWSSKISAMLPTLATSRTRRIGAEVGTTRMNSCWRSRSWRPRA